MDEWMNGWMDGCWSKREKKEVLWAWSFFLRIFLWNQQERKLSWGKSDLRGWKRRTVKKRENGWRADTTKTSREKIFGLFLFLFFWLDDLLNPFVCASFLQMVYLCTVRITSKLFLVKVAVSFSKRPPALSFGRKSPDPLVESTRVITAILTYGTMCWAKTWRILVP